MWLPGIDEKDLTQRSQRPEYRGHREETKRDFSTSQADAFADERERKSRPATLEMTPSRWVETKGEEKMGNDGEDD